MSQISLQPGETLVARVPQDREIAILVESLFGIFGLGVVSAYVAVFGSGGEKAGSSIGTLITFAFLLGPIVVQRLMRPMPVYWLTDRRLVLNQDTEIALADIRRIRVWLTGLSLRTDQRRYAINLLANPSAVATLLRDTIAR